MFKLMIMVWLFFLALVCATTVQFDGVVAGQAFCGINVVQVRVGHRMVAFGTRTFRPGRVYWQIAVC